MTPDRLTIYRVWMARAYQHRTRAAMIRARIRSVGTPSVSRLRDMCSDAGARIAEHDGAAARAYSAAAIIRDGAPL